MKNHSKSTRNQTPNKSNRYFIRNRTHELNSRFREVTRGMGPNNVGTQLNTWQADYAYLIHDANTGPEYIAPKHLMKAEELIAKIQKTRAKSK